MTKYAKCDVCGYTVAIQDDANAGDYLCPVDGSVLVAATEAEHEHVLFRQEATFIVAASDSLHKERADYVCDGVDDQVEIQAAIDALPAIGGKVLLMEGEYTISSRINLKSNLNFEGISAKLVAKDALNGYIVYAHNKENIRIVGIEIDGNRDNQSVELANMHINTCVNTIIDRIYSHHGSGDGVEIYAGDNVLVTNSIFMHNLEHDVHINRINNARVTNNYMCYNDAASVIVLDTVPTIIGTKDVIISGNTIHGSNEGVSIHGDGMAGKTENVIVSNNTIHNCKQDGIVIYENAQHITIIGNQIFDNNTVGGYAGVFLTGDGINNIKDVTIANNEIFNNKCGIHAWFAEKVLVIGGKISKNQRQGMYIHDDCSISINSVLFYDNSQAGDGIDPAIWSFLSDGTQRIHLINCEIVSTSTPRHSYALLVSGSGTLSTNIYRNYIENVVHTPSLSLGAGTHVIRDNVGYTTENSGTATITAGQASVDVTHGLSATPTRVILTPMADTGGKRFWISAKGATTFTITIDSTHTADISFDWRAQVGEG